MGVPKVSFADAARVALLLLLILPESQAANPVDDLTGPWHLLVDDYPVLARNNLVRTYHPFEKYTNNPVLVADQPWEGLVYLYGTVLPDESGTSYRMWYHTLRPSDTNNDGSLELYAVSPDGIHWTKPELNLRSWHGSTSNNMYFTRPTAGGITSVMQTPGDPNPAHLYQFMNLDSGGYYGAWSPDGIHITDVPGNPVFTGGSDVGQFCWDPHTQLFRGYVKNAWYDWNGLKRRAVALTTTTSIANWPQESLILWPDPLDDRWVPAGTVQRTHFYGLSAFPYESIYIGFLWIFRATDVEGYYVGPCFVELVSSHDGIHWTREEGNRPPILPLGPAGAWDDGMVFTARAPVLEGDTIKLWYGGFDQVHGTALTKTTGSIGLATLRKDGFASLDAETTIGTLLTKPLAGASGALRVNYRAVGGSLKVEVLDAHNNVLPGYSQADCTALTGDSVSQAVTWAAHAELPVGVSGLRLRFVLQNASLYAFMAGPSATLVDVPTISQHPSDRTIVPGESATFTVVASALSPLGYQWQRNQMNLADGGHYSGCMTSTLTITSADSADVGSYRCVVTNAYGSVTSSSAMLLLSTNVAGAVTLTAIPLLAGDTNSDARAITPDGRWVAGVSGSRGFLYAVSTSNVFDVVGSDGSRPTLLTGVGYRTNNGQQQIVVSGLSGGLPTTWMTADGGATWGAKVRYSDTTPKKPTIPAANALAGTSSDVFYSVWTDEGPGATDNWGMYIGRFSNAWPAAVAWGLKAAARPDTVQANGISAHGRVAGWRRNGTTLVYANYVADWNGTTALTYWNFYGLDGTTAGQALSVSADGTVIFGMSPKGAATGSTNYGYKAVFDAAFPGPATQLSTNPLPNFPDTGGSLKLALPYGCTPDGKYAVGLSSRSGVSTAVLWDTTDPNPAKWTVLDLMKYASAQGIAGTFTSLTCAYSAGLGPAGDVVIAGVGISGGASRAFVMTLPTPIRTPVVLSSSSPAGLTFTFLSLGSTRLTNYLEYTTHLSPPQIWTTVSSTQCAGNLTILSAPNPLDQQRFYRIRVQ